VRLGEVMDGWDDLFAYGFSIKYINCIIHLCLWM